MAKINRIAVQVTYTVALIDIDMQQDEMEQLIEIAEKCGQGTVKSESTKFQSAVEWLNQNIREQDSMGHSYTIMDISIPD